MKTRWIRLLFAFGLLAFTAACLVSEQEGMRNERVVFHFNTTFNKAVLIGGPGLLLLIAGWVFSARRKGSWTMVAAVSLPATAIALWLASSGFATLRNYRLVIEESEFVFTVPPADERRIPWLSLEELKLEGEKFEGKGFVEMAEWKTLELKMVGGESIVLDVGRLSVEHRQILADLIIDRVKNARQGTKPLW